MSKRKLTRGDMEWMQIPPEYWRVTIQQVPESIRAQILQYAANAISYVERPVGLLLVGPIGVGKTSAAVVLAKEVRSWSKSVLFISVWELREDVRNRVMFDDHHSMLDRCREVDLLVLDGLKPEDATAHYFGAKELEELLSSRTSHRKATFLTTRCSMLDLRSKGFGLVLDSVTGAMVPLEVRGPNLRLEQHKELMAVFGAGNSKSVEKD